MLVSCSRWSIFRALQGRQAATTLSHVWVPPLERGITWSMFSAGALQYWQRWPSRTNTARPVERDPCLVGHLDVVAEADDRRLGPDLTLGLEGPVGRGDLLGLSVQHEHQRPPRGHHAERLVAGVENERSGHAATPSASGSAPWAHRPHAPAGTMPLRGAEAWWHPHRPARLLGRQCRPASTGARPGRRGTSGGRRRRRPARARGPGRRTGSPSGTGSRSASGTGSQGGGATNPVAP